MWEKVGREPSGSAFNSIVQLEHEQGRPRNPLINPGAMVVTDTLIGGRGGGSRGPDAVAAAIAQTRGFLQVMIDHVGAVQREGGTLREAFERTHAALVDDYGRWPIFEHCLPFDVSRLWDELSGVERPVIWTAERDQEVCSSAHRGRAADLERG